MLTHASCWLDNIGLQDLDESIVIEDIREIAPNVTRQFASAAGRDGSRMLFHRRDMLRVEIMLMIREQDPERRHSICQEINRWATNGQYLTTNDRVGQRLRVVRDEPLMTISVMRWTQSLKLTFAAYERPYWEDETPTFIRWVSAKQQHEGVLFLPGTAEKAPAEAEIIPAQGGSGDVTVRVGDTVITLAGLTLTAGQAVRIGYDASGLMEIRNGGVSVMKSRTGESSDELLAVPGQSSAISITAPVPVTAVVSARGCWV